MVRGLVRDWLFVSFIVQVESQHNGRVRCSGSHILQEILQLMLLGGGFLRFLCRKKGMGPRDSVQDLSKAISRCGMPRPPLMPWAEEYGHPL